MGGRGAASGVSDKGRKYGTEYHSVLVKDNIKFIKYNFGNATAPYETQGGEKRIYVTVNNKDIPKYITTYDSNGKRTKQIDLTGQGHYVNGEKLETPHVHVGYEHQGSVTRRLTKEERALVEYVNKVWNNRT